MLTAFEVHLHFFFGLSFAHDLQIRARLPFPEFQHVIAMAPEGRPIKIDIIVTCWSHTLMTDKN